MLKLCTHPLLPWTSALSGSSLAQNLYHYLIPLLQFSSFQTADHGISQLPKLYIFSACSTVFLLDYPHEKEAYYSEKRRKMGHWVPTILPDKFIYGLWQLGLNFESKSDPESVMLSCARPNVLPKRIWTGNVANQKKSDNCLLKETCL